MSEISNYLTATLIMMIGLSPLLLVVSCAGVRTIVNWRTNYRLAPATA